MKVLTHYKFGTNIEKLTPKQLNYIKDGLKYSLWILKRPTVGEEVELYTRSEKDEMISEIEDMLCRLDK